MNIAFFVDNYFTKNAFSDSLKLLKSFCKKNGHEVFIFTTYEESQIKNVEKEENVFLFKASSIKSYYQIKLSVSPFLSAKKILKEKKVDFIHSFSISSLGLSSAIFKKELKIPGVITLYDVFHYFGLKTNRIEEIVKDILKKYLLWIVDHFDAIHYPSVFAKNHFQKIIEKRKDYHIAYMPFQVPQKNNQKERNKVSYLGPIDKRFDIEKLCKVMPQIKNKTGKEIEIMAIEEREEALEREMKDKVKKINYDERFKYYEDLICYIEPKNLLEYNFYALESLALGNIVITHRENATAEILESLNMKDFIYEDETYLSDPILKAIEINRNHEEEKYVKKEHIMKMIEDNAKIILSLYENTS